MNAGDQHGEKDLSSRSVASGRWGNVAHIRKKS